MATQVCGMRARGMVGEGVAGRLLTFDGELPSRSGRAAPGARIPEAEDSSPAEAHPAGRRTSGRLLQPCERELSIIQCLDA